MCGLWALNREVNHKVDTLAGGCLAVERDEGGGRVERGSTGGLSVGLQEAENWGVATRRRPLYTLGACELWTVDQAKYRVKGRLRRRGCGAGEGP